MSNNQYSSEASTSRCKKRTTTSNHLLDDVRSRRRKAELQQLERRLRVLEEEAEMLKGALLESVEENKRQITEIHQHFNTVRRCLLQRQGESYSKASQIMSLFEDSRDGLLQILCQDSNPSIVDKGLKFQAKLPWIFPDGD